MKHQVSAFISFLQHLLGLSIWRITTKDQHRVKSVILSKFALLMSIFNFTLALYCFFTMDRKSSNKILNLANLHKTYLFQLGDHVLKLTFLARFYMIYLTVWVFCRQQKMLYQCFLDADQILGDLKQMTLLRPKEELNKSRHQFYVLVRLLVLVFSYCGTVGSHSILAALGCNFYKNVLRNSKALISGMILVISGLASLFDIACCLAFVESRFETIQQWILCLE